MNSQQENPPLGLNFSPSQLFTLSTEFYDLLSETELIYKVLQRVANHPEDFKDQDCIDQNIRKATQLVTVELVKTRRLQIELSIAGASKDWPEYVQYAALASKVKDAIHRLSSNACYQAEECVLTENSSLKSGIVLLVIL